MPRQFLEVADIFQQYGHQWHQSQAGHISLEQLSM